MAIKLGSHVEVIDAFVNGEDHPYKGHNVFFRDDVLYSYGRHFPLAVRNVDGMIVVNGDKSSVSTTKHQTILRRCLARRSHFTTSFSAIESWAHLDIPFSLQKGILKIVSYTPDVSNHNESGIKLSDIPSGAHVETFEGKIIYYHLPASVLLSLQHIDSDKITYAIASMDENQYFVSVLPCTSDNAPNTVDGAFDMLKPEIVKDYEQEYGPVPRQGEWFFLDMRMPKDIAKKAYDEMEQGYHLIGQNQGNPHAATRGHNKFNAEFVSGQIRHPQHRMLKLSTLKNIKIYQAVENTAVISYSSSGNVD